MSLTLEQACMSGASVFSPLYRHGVRSAVDFVAAGSGGVAVLSLGWPSDPTPGVGVTMIGGTLEQAGDSWRVVRADGLVCVLSPNDPGDAEQLEIDLAREEQDVEREKYLEALQRLKEDVTEVDFDPWIDTVLNRPKLDPRAWYREQVATIRRVGIIYLVGADGNRADVLAIDSEGQAAVVYGNPWLRGLASNWSESESRPALEDFVAHVAGMTPHGLYSVGATKVTDLAGGVGEIAMRAFREASPTQ